MRAPAPQPKGHQTDDEALRVRLFGELALDLGGRPLGPIESTRARSLLGYLMLHREAPQARQRLAFLLWPDSTEAQARTNLRKALHTLRRDTPELERFLAITTQTVQWVSRGPVEIDVEVFGSALAAAAGSSGDACIAALGRAVDCYAGDLLDGCYDEWLVDARERLRDQYVSAVARLAALLSDRGDHDEAVRLARELVRCEPLRDASHRLLMAVYAASGDRAAAVRAYHECVSTLQRELGVAPSRETSDAYAALTQRSGPDDDGEVALGAAPLVGREVAWRRLTRLWLDASSGRAQLVVVTGEPGVGKSRLVDELGAWCAHQGAVVAQGRSYPTEGELGFGLVISWLRGGLRECLRRGARADVAELALLLPELDPGTERPPAATDDAERRRRLFDAAARVVLSGDQPVLIVADDAQCSDTQSVRLLHYLLRFDPGAPLLAIATVRREDLEDSHLLHELLGSLTVDDRVTEIALDRLSPADTAELARGLVGDAIGPSAVDELFADTEGNPLFIVESVRAGWPTTSDASALSPRLQAVVTARVRQLTAAARDLLGVAAAVGRDFTVPLLRGASELDEPRLARALDEIWRRGLVRERGADGYDFSHGKVREVVYSGLEPADRRHKHLLVAETLRQLHEDAPGSVSGQIAYHYDRAGRPDEAIGWYRQGAVEAQRRYANAEAVRLLDRAHELAAALPEAHRLTRELEVLSALPTPLAGVEGFASERLATTQERVLRLAGELGLQPDPAVLRSLVMSRLCRDEFDDAVIAAGQLRDVAHRTSDEGLLVESEYLLGIGAFWSGDLESARDRFVEVVTRFRPEQRPQHLVRFGHDPQIVCLSRLGNTLRFLGDIERARRARDDAVALAEQVGHPFSRGTALIFGALLAVDLGEAERVSELAAALHRDPHAARPNDILGTALDGYADLLAGHTAGGLETIRRAIETSGPVNHAPGSRAALLRLSVAAQLLAGDAEGGLAAADAALRLGGTRLWEADVRLARARFLAELGRAEAEG